MASIARIGDEVSGTCFQPGHGKGNPPQVCTGTITGGSENTFNTSNVARLGDSVQLKCNQNHTTTISGCSSKVFTNGKGVARIGDSVGSGDFVGTITSGSSNTFSG